MSPDPPDLPVPVEPAERVCPGCFRLLPADAVVCIECGWHRERRRKVQANSQPFARTWNGWHTVLVRLGVFAGTSAVAGLLLWHFNPEGPPAAGLAAVAVVLALAMGSFAQVKVERRGDGRAFLTRRLWLAFLPLPARRADLGRYDAVRLVDSHRVRLPFPSVLLELIAYEWFDVRGLHPLTWWNETKESYRRAWAAPWDKDRLDPHYRRAPAALLELRGPRQRPFPVYWGRNEVTVRELTAALDRAAGLPFARG
jgi:hypothetical protein